MHVESMITNQAVFALLGWTQLVGLRGLTRVGIIVLFIKGGFLVDVGILCGNVILSPSISLSSQNTLLWPNGQGARLTNGFRASA